MSQRLKFTYYFGRKSVANTNQVAWLEKKLLFLLVYLSRYNGQINVRKICFSFSCSYLSIWLRDDYSIQNNYLRLEEAVNSIIAEEDDDEFDLLVVPPEPGAVTDEEEGPEDDLVTHALPRDVPGTIEVVRRGRSPSDWDSSDDEPLTTSALTAKRPRTSAPTAVVTDNPTWRKTLPIYSTTHEVTNAIEERLESLYSDIKDCTPVMLFEKIFDNQMCDWIVQHSLLYAGQNNRHGFQYDRDSLKGFLGILLI